MENDNRPGASQGRVYIWSPDPTHTLGGRVAVRVVPLSRLEPDGDAPARLRGRHVQVHNAGAINEPDPTTGRLRVVPLGDAHPDAEGNFLFEPGHGGGRIDKVRLAAPDVRGRYIQAARFGEVNTYYHLDRSAAYVDDLLRQLGAPSLPRVTAVVTAHAGSTETDGRRDGVRHGDRWLPFQGGHYRLPSRTYDIDEHQPLSPDGEIHLGPGWRLIEHGALVDAAGGRYRANASHNGGILYHEYGHHITRHMADLRANSLRHPSRQNNRKTALDEGTCDYWTATMLDTPHIWAWHRRHDDQEAHPRSLISAKTMDAYCHDPGADPHANGTIWGAALWDLRTQMRAAETEGARHADLLVLQALLLLGQVYAPQGAPTIPATRAIRAGYTAGLEALLGADQRLSGGRRRDLIRSTFAARGIHPQPNGGLSFAHEPVCL